MFWAGIRANVAAILAADNHPSSASPTPSPEDVSLTKAMVEAGRLVDIDLLDHLIIGHGRYVSLKAKMPGLQLGCRRPTFRGPSHLDLPFVRKTGVRQAPWAATRPTPTPSCDIM